MGEHVGHGELFICSSEFDGKKVEEAARGQEG